MIFKIFTPKPLIADHLKLSDAEARVEQKLSEITQHDLRKRIPIVAIDDQEFPPEINLRNSGFSIQTLSDINRITDVDSYQIVLCDLNDIGTNLSPESQGAYVIEEIKSKYPDKVVIAYTAASVNSKLFIKARSVADEYVKKDITIEKWRDLLDEKIKFLSNPIKVWKNERKRLLDHGMELQDLIKIEQILLKNLDNGKDVIKEAINIETGNTSSATWKGEISRFLLSKTFDYAFDYLVKT